jgi:hypothetical protein
MYKYITALFFVTFFLFSCGGNSTPDGIIEQKQMTSLLTEVHLVDGRMYGIMQSQDSINIYGTKRYDVLFKRFNTDSVQFKKSLKYYAMQPAQLTKMYDEILKNLKTKTDSLSKLQRKTDSLKRIPPQKQKPVS